MEAASWQSCKLFVGGLSTQTTTEALRSHFAQYGRLVDAVVMSKQGRPRGFGFVTYEAPAAATAALAEPQWLGDRFVDVKRAVPGEQPEDRSPNKIFVGGLPQDASTEDLRACFAEYGPIADAVVMVDRRTKRSRGFGFIRFASSTQGTRAAEKVLQDAANHRLGGKWVEVKPATPAALLQDLSPGSTAASPSSPCTPTQLSTPVHRQQRDLKPRNLGQHAAWGESCLGLWGGLDHMGGMVNWPGSPGFSPMHYGSFDSPLGMHSSFAGLATYRSDRSDDEACSSGHSTGLSEGDENKPLAANRSLTPPPGIKRPPGLGLASPMKIECRSGLFDSLGMEDGCAFQEHAKKVQPWLPAH